MQWPEEKKALNPMVGFNYVSPSWARAKGSSKQLPRTLKMKMVEAHKSGEGCKKIAKCFQVVLSSVRMSCSTSRGCMAPRLPSPLSL
ncbi:unnamed protein product [Ranitomeya imitator]|uniref:Uncharacterized protein n=1 Tax=Ranitomeya imitator TaxID=111125 RepID=A0ABN9M8G8_9NEOB|nr:unnamed protein product [Ranitomeya imitator]